jgi:hypothetical protein
LDVASFHHEPLENSLSVCWRRAFSQITRMACLKVG